MLDAIPQEILTAIAVAYLIVFYAAVGIACSAWFMWREKMEIRDVGDCCFAGWLAMSWPVFPLFGVLYLLGCAVKYLGQQTTPVESANSPSCEEAP